MNDQWHAVWNRRKASPEAVLSLDSLIALNGFDTGATAICASDWRTNARKLALALDIRNGESVYEVGCGCGAFLYALQEFIDIRLAGSDYSSTLVDIAKRVFPESSFDLNAAVDINTLDRFDHVLSHSMFHYLSLDEASIALRKMLTKARRTVGIFDLPDIALRDAAEEMRRGNLPAGEYDKRYDGLAHTYFDKAWLLSEIRRFAPEAHVELMRSQIENNPQSPFRFGVIVRLRPNAANQGLHDRTLP